MKRLFVVLVLFLLVSCSSQETVSRGKSKNVEVDDMARVLFVIAHDGFQDNEFFVTKEVLSGFDVKVASSSSPAKGALGGEVVPDFNLAQALEKIDEFDAVVFVGGPGASEFFDDNTAHKIAQNAGNVIAAICIAPVILANAGVLDGKKATVWDDGKGTQKKMLENKGVAVIDKPVVVDGNVVTANGPSAARMFGERIRQLLES